ncbi:surface protein, ECM binding protein-like protein A [Staphylococcus aureus]|uniref:Surface protein, ECM binding protein-like protein A n=1 Tax=Staphylococcus aureus TaxID=1280 RepID=A0A380E1D3_STAAU|nr:surface protein, ECM binding protein-like protein A [Staphylococcus aureus]
MTAKQQALNGQENLRTAQTNAKQHLNGLSDLTNATKKMQQNVKSKVQRMLMK